MAEQVQLLVAMPKDFISISESIQQEERTNAHHIAL